ARSQAECKQDAANSFKHADKICIECGRENAKAGQELNKFRNRVQVGPAGLEKLPAPVKPDDQQKWGLQGITNLTQPSVEQLDFSDHFCGASSGTRQNQPSPDQ